MSYDLEHNVSASLIEFINQLEGGVILKNQSLHITFHNPNSDEETARFLSKMIAQHFADSIIRNEMAEPYISEDISSITGLTNAI